MREAGNIAGIPSVVERFPERPGVGRLQVRGETDIAAPALVVAEFDDGHHQYQENLADRRRSAARFHLAQHALSPFVEHRCAIDDHLTDQLFLGAEMIMQGGVVALSGRGNDLLHGHRVGAMAGEQQLRRRLDLVPGLFRGGAGHGPHSG